MRIFIINMLVCCLLLSCVGSKKSVKYASEECLSLSEEERNIYPIDEKGLSEYESCCLVANAQTALNRVILGKNYNYFIALSFQMIPQDYDTLMRKDSSLNILTQKTFSTKDKYFYAYFIKRHPALFINRIVYTEPKTDLLIVFDHVSTDSLLIAHSYENHKEFLSKINCN